MRNCTTRGYTLIELLVTLTIISILASLLLSAMSRAQDEVETTGCRGNLRELHVVISEHTSDNSNKMPYARYGRNNWWREIAERVGFEITGTAPRDIEWANGKNSDDNIYRCPTKEFSEDPTDWEFVSYGYNIDAGFTYSDNVDSIQRFRYPVNIVRVTSPSDAMALTERAPGAGLYEEDYFESEWIEQLATHNDSFNALFLDGQVQRVKDKPEDDYWYEWAKENGQ